MANPRVPSSASPAVRRSQARGDDVTALGDDDPPPAAVNTTVAQDGTPAAAIPPPRATPSVPHGADAASHNYFGILGDGDSTTPNTSSTDEPSASAPPSALSTAVRGPTKQLFVMAHDASALAVTGDSVDGGDAGATRDGGRSHDGGIREMLVLLLVLGGIPMMGGIRRPRLRVLMLRLLRLLLVLMRLLPQVLMMPWPLLRVLRPWMTLLWITWLSFAGLLRPLWNKRLNTCNHSRNLMRLACRSPSRR